MTALFRRVAGALGWTPGQVWTVAVGLVVAVPAALFGLGPSLNVLHQSRLALATPPAAAAPSAASTPPPAILGGNASAPVTGTPAGRSSASAGSASEPRVTTTVPSASAGGAESIFATVRGPGTVRSLAVAADAVAVAVDMGAGAAGRVVVLDADGAVASDTSLVINGVPYQQPGGVAVTEGGVLVSTTAPAAVLRVDPVSGSVTKVADIPDVPVCLPVVHTSDCQAAVPDTAPHPEQLAVGDGGIYVADRAQACVFRVAPGETRATAWLCDLSFAGSPATNGSGGLDGLAVAGDRVVFTVAAAFDGGDSVQDVTVSNGAPANRRTLAAPANGAGVAGVAVLDDGRIVAALTNANSLFVVAPDGSSKTLKLDGVTAPVDLDVRADSLLVAEQGAIAERSLSSLS